MAVRRVSPCYKQGLSARSGPVSREGRRQQFAIVHLSVCPAGRFAYVIMVTEGTGGPRCTQFLPCGGYQWTVVRTGADIGLKCATCGRRVLLDREDFERRAKEVRQVRGAADDAVARDAGAATHPSGDTL
jgi:hypothetical protein